MTTENHEHTTPEPTSETTREREVIVTNGNPGTNWAGVVVGILAVIVFGLLGYMFIGTLAGEDGGSPMPDEVNVDLETGGEGGGAEG